MHFFLKFHQLAAERGDGLHPDLLELLLRSTSADQALAEAAALTALQDGRGPDGLPLMPAKSEEARKPNDLYGRHG